MLKILVTGKTGQGKSSLINGILGGKVVAEGAGASRCTTEVEMFSKTIHGVPVKVFDFPGLQDGTANEEEYIQGMKAKCGELSLVLYCTKMINTRLADDDKHAIVKLTEAFGEKFWVYAVFVLTFANKEDCERKDDRDEDIPEPALDDDDGWKGLIKKRFQGRLIAWKNDLKEFLINEVGVSPKVAETIPVVPTGDYKKSRANKYPFHLPDHDNWSNEFWKSIHEKGQGIADLKLLSVSKQRNSHGHGKDGQDSHEHGQNGQKVEDADIHTEKRKENGDGQKSLGHKHGQKGKDGQKVEDADLHTEKRGENGQKSLGQDSHEHEQKGKDGQKVEDADLHTEKRGENGQKSLGQDHEHEQKGKDGQKVEDADLHTEKRGENGQKSLGQDSHEHEQKGKDGQKVEDADLHTEKRGENGQKSLGQDHEHEQKGKDGQKVEDADLHTEKRGENGQKSLGQDSHEHEQKGKDGQKAEDTDLHTEKRGENGKDGQKVFCIII